MKVLNRDSGLQPRHMNDARRGRIHVEGFWKSRVFSRQDIPADEPVFKQEGPDGKFWFLRGKAHPMRAFLENMQFGRYVGFDEGFIEAQAVFRGHASILAGMKKKRGGSEGIDLFFSG